MTSMTSTFIRNLNAERYKLKGTPLFWLTALGGFLIPFFVFILYYAEVVSFAPAGANPWNEFFSLGLSMLSYLLVIPFVVLVSSSIVNLEHSSNSWKQLYALPQSRGHIYFSKLTTAVGLVAFTYVVFTLAMVLLGFMIGSLVPAYHLQDFSPNVAGFLQSAVWSFVSVLGMIAIQYWMSTRFKNYLLSIGLGMLGFIISISLNSRPDIAQYFPYTFSMFMAPEAGHTIMDAKGIQIILSSLGCFIGLSLLGFYQESNGNVK